jgi:hypothetical protein
MLATLETRTAVNTQECVFLSPPVACHAVDMEYKICLHRNPGIPLGERTPADWHGSLEELEAVMNKWAKDGWTFPGAEIEAQSGPGVRREQSYRLHAGTKENPGFLAVKP